MYLALVALPGLGAASGFLGRKLGATGVQLTTTLSVLFAFCCAMLAAPRPWPASPPVARAR